MLILEMSDVYGQASMKHSLIFSPDVQLKHTSSLHPWYAFRITLHQFEQASTAQIPVDDMNTVRYGDMEIRDNT
jgi:hypothetical protein